MYYLIGMCQKEMRDFGDAHEAFNNAILVSAVVMNGDLNNFMAIANFVHSP